MRRACGVLLAAVLVGASACADDDAGPGLSPPGTPLAAGLEVTVTDLDGRAELVGAAATAMNAWIEHDFCALAG